MLTKKVKILLAGVLFAITGGIAAADADTQKQIDGIKDALPKFAIPMREVGDRFQNMYFAAKGGNWALAAYYVEVHERRPGPGQGDEAG